MTLTIELPNELERALAAEAERLGLSLDEYALHVLSTRGTGTAQPRTGAELVAFWKTEGVVGARPDIADAPAHARAVRERAEHRYRS